MEDFIKNMTQPEQDKIFDATIQLIAAERIAGNITYDNGVDINKRNWMRDCVETAVKAYLFTHTTTEK